MHYLSTRNNNLKESFTDILFQGLSKDGGLYLPSNWPQLSVNHLKGKSYSEIAYEVIYPFVKEGITQKELNIIIDNTYNNFSHEQTAPLVNIEKNRYILELFYGPTLAFKDYAMQFLGNLFLNILGKKNKKITILGATSGDTGSAAINSFMGKKDIQVFILHPYNRVSEIQRKQMTTIKENNIFNIAIKGSFDDCQKIVKKLFLDNNLQEKTSLTAVNSINWARIISQTVYYFWAYVNLNTDKVNFIVPTGNFGNVFSARVAKFMGLPIECLHIVTNSNDILHRSFISGNMSIEEVKKTHSPSMDIQISSNFERQIFESCKRNSDLVKKLMSSFAKKGSEVLTQDIIEDMKFIYETHSISNEQTIETIKYFKQKYNYLADPHTATGLNILDKIEGNIPTVSLACAHPAKFQNTILEALDCKINLPKEIENILDKEEKMTILDNNIDEVKNFILNNL